MKMITNYITPQTSFWIIFFLSLFNIFGRSSFLVFIISIVTLILSSTSLYLYYTSEETKD